MFTACGIIHPRCCRPVDWMRRNCLNGTHQLLAYADDVNILGGGIHTLKENAEALVAATREIRTGSKC